MPMDALGRCTSCGAQITSTGGGCPNLYCPTRSVSHTGGPINFEFDPLHPSGRCTCAGEGICGWCKQICKRCGGDGTEPENPTESQLAKAVRDFVRAKEDHDLTAEGTAYFAMIDLSNQLLD